jgi:hypothetical protein
MPDTKYALMATAIALCFMKHEIESAGSHWNNQPRHLGHEATNT